MTERIPGKYDYLKKSVSNKKDPVINRGSNSKFLIGFLLVIGLFSVFLLNGYLLDTSTHNMDYEQESVDMWEAETPAGYDMVMFTNQDCSCCHIYIDYLAEFGYTMATEYPDNLQDMKDYQGIPRNSRSCHTIKFGDYFIEGHIPIEAVELLQSSQPNIDGISLPGMPSGSPGMAGEKSGTFEILSIKNGEIVGTFLSI